MLIVAGTRLRREDVLALSSMLAGDGADRTARLLLAALTKCQEFVALTQDDKECILAVLAHPPVELADLRKTLFDEINWQRTGLTPPARPDGIGGVAGRPSRKAGRVAWV